MRVLIEVRGGRVEDILADTACVVEVLDYDAMEHTSDALPGRDARRIVQLTTEFDAAAEERARWIAKQEESDERNND